MKNKTSIRPKVTVGGPLLDKIRILPHPLFLTLLQVFLESTHQVIPAVDLLGKSAATFDLVSVLTASAGFKVFKVGSAVPVQCPERNSA